MGRYVCLGFLLCAHALLGASLCEGDPRPRSSCAGWESLQQLRSLIPERIWEQEFSVRINRKAFQRSIAKWQMRQKRDEWGNSCVAVAHTRNYFLRSTFSGENVRLLDRYQEFECSPFWNNPPMMDDLSRLEKRILKGGPSL